MWSVAPGGMQTSLYTTVYPPTSTPTLCGCVCECYSAECRGWKGSWAKSFQLLPLCSSPAGCRLIILSLIFTFTPTQFICSLQSNHPENVAPKHNFGCMVRLLSKAVPNSGILFYFFKFFTNLWQLRGYLYKCLHPKFDCYLTYKQWILA